MRKYMTVEQYVQHFGYLNLLVLLCGGSSCGKTTISEELEKDGEGLIKRLEQDGFYKPARPGATRRQLDKRNYDIPPAFDNKLLVDTTLGLLRNEPQVTPQWDYETHSRKPVWLPCPPARIILLEGMHLQRIKPLVRSAFLIFFVDAPPDARFGRRIKRDMERRGRTAKSVCDQWPTVQAGFLRYVAPYRDEADMVIPRGAENRPAYEMLKAYLLDLARQLPPLPTV